MFWFVKATLDVDCLIFDLLGLLIERVMKSFDMRLMHNEIIPVIKSLLLRYPLELQRRCVLLRKMGTGCLAYLNLLLAALLL